MQLGAFSISLTVKDIKKSKEFYEKLGFATGGDVEQGWLIMKNREHIIGLFQGMFAKNMLTFNPDISRRQTHILILHIIFKRLTPNLSNGYCLQFVLFEFSKNLASHFTRSPSNHSSAMLYRVITQTA